MRQRKDKAGSRTIRVDDEVYACITQVRGRLEICTGQRQTPSQAVKFLLALASKKVTNG